MPTHGVHAVVGTTGFTDDDLERARLPRSTRAPPTRVIAPNFAIGAVLMMRFAELAAPYFETAEIIELHHDQKIDAPSGTATLHRAAHGGGVDRLGRRPDRRSVVVDGARGGDGPAASASTRCGCGAWWPTRRCCSARPARRLSIRHDSYDRTSFMPGVLLAVRKVRDRPGLTIGLDALLGL